MTQLNKLQKAQIKQWLNEDSYQAVFQFFSNRIQELESQEITGNNEFETLRELHKKQGAVEALKNFFNDLDKQGYE